MQLDRLLLHHGPQRLGGRVVPLLDARLAIRTGVRLNMLSDEPGGTATAFSVGGTVATFRSLLVDAQVTMGAEAADRGWGIAARLVY